MKPVICLAVFLVILAAQAFTPSRILAKCGEDVECRCCHSKFECRLDKGHSGSHVAPPGHRCKTIVRCNSCSKTEQCRFNCTSTTTNHQHTRVWPHDCKRTAYCPRCSFQEPCVYGECGHGGPHRVSSHQCRRTADCPNGDHARCKLDCGHSYSHKPVAHKCPQKGKCMLCKSELKCNNPCGHGAIHMGICTTCKKLMPMKVD